MATNFFSRWSQRKLDDSADQASQAEQAEQAEQALESDHKLEEIQVASSEAPTSETSSDALSSADVETSESLENAPDAEIEATQNGATEASEDLSVAQLLVSEASESVKKTALRKLFLSEEFNVRDGLDDYDDDYSNLKSLSEGVAESLRDWVKEKVEEETPSEQEQATENQEEASINNAEEAELDLVESDEITRQKNKLYKNTVSDHFDSDAIKNDPKEVRQNIPHKE